LSISSFVCTSIRLSVLLLSGGEEDRTSFNNEDFFCFFFAALIDVGSSCAFFLKMIKVVTGLVQVVNTSVFAEGVSGGMWDFPR
jgi:hypothetical protein